MPPQRSVILDAELGEHTSGKPVGIMLTSLSEFNDLLPDQLGHPIFRARGELELGAHSLKGPVHGLNVLGLVSESSGSGPYHHGAADDLELAVHRHSHATARCGQMCDRHEELKTRRANPTDPRVIAMRQHGPWRLTPRGADAFSEQVGLRGAIKLMTTAIVHCVLADGRSDLSDFVPPFVGYDDPPSLPPVLFEGGGYFVGFTQGGIFVGQVSASPISDALLATFEMKEVPWHEPLIQHGRQRSGDEGDELTYSMSWPRHPAAAKPSSDVSR